MKSQEELPSPETNSFWGRFLHFFSTLPMLIDVGKKDSTHSYGLSGRSVGFVSKVFWVYVCLCPVTPLGELCHRLEDISLLKEDSNSPASLWGSRESGKAQRRI
jgi:hypothetical protein